MRSTGREHVVLDVREARELDVCQLEGALHIPMAEIPARVNDLPTNHPLVVLCHHSARTRMVVDFLRDAGFDNALNLAACRTEVLEFVAVLVWQPRAVVFIVLRAVGAMRAP